MWSTIASWAAIFAFGVALTRYYNPQLFDKLLPQRTVETVSELKPAKKLKNKRNKFEEEGGTSAPANGNDAPSKKRKIVSAPVSETVKATTAQGQQAILPRDDDGDMSNREFAQQLAKAQAGTRLEKNQAPTKKEKRAAKALQSQPGVGSPSLSAETSSLGGRDGDDDMSPNDTLATGTPSTAHTSRAGDVSDMLEPAGPKPTTLRLTGIAPTQQKQAPKQFEQVLTKKQRQRQAKQEENRQLREEADRLHEAKKQQQLRTARTAAGTSNQTKANTFASTSHPNAWQKKPDVQTSSSQPQQQPLLDTFEPETPKPNGAVSAAPLENITNGLNRNENVNAVRQQLGGQKTDAMAPSSREGRPDLSRGASWADEVNEDAQDEWAKRLVENESWEPVTSKKSKKKNNKKDTDTSSEASTSVARPQPATNGVKKTSATRPESNNRFASMEPLNGDTWEA